MKILFIVNTIDFIDPQGIMQLSAIAKGKGHEVILAILSREKVLRKIQELNPQVIAYSATTGEHKYYFQINELIKKEFPLVFTVMGGAHPTFFPECIQGSSLDAICRGEGDEAFPQLLDSLEEGGDISSIPNIATKEKMNEVRPLYHELDTLPFPDRDIFYKTTEMGEFPIKSFMVSRGCPYHCTYCFNHSLRQLYRDKGKYVRRKSVTRSIEEIQEVRSRYPLQFIKFYDDIFAYPRDPWLEEFRVTYKRDVHLPFHCFTRADLMDEELIKVLKDTGCVSISMSIETAQPYLRNEVLKRNMRDEQIYRAFELCHAHGVRTFANSMVALPDSQLKDDIASLEMNIRCKVTFAEFPICQPYPGTELGSYCRQRGYFDAAFDAMHWSCMFESPLTCFTKKQKRIQKNLSLLGTVAVWKPFLKNLICRYLIYVPNNIFYTLAYILVKMHLIKTKIYPCRLSFKYGIGLVLKEIFVDIAKHSQEHAYEKSTHH